MKCNKAAVRRLVLLAAALAVLSSLSCNLLANSAPTAAPMNPAFANYFQSTQARTMSAGGHPEGLVPEPFVLPRVSRTALQSTVSLPTSYDLRPLGKLTPIRNQGSCGDCWAFATMGSLESFLMPLESWDFSENNLKDLAGFDFGCCSGGNRAMSTAYLARWAGPVAETDDPYNATSCSSPAGKLPRKHVQDVIFVPNRASALDNDALKQAVMTYGAVYTTYYHSDYYYNSSKAAYYYTGSSRPNHAVCIVGWDDNYAASNFLTSPPGNGAFLIRNSWGPYWGMSGYFWMSYYDTDMGKTENAVFTAEPTTNYDQIYQYDPLGWISSTGYGSSTAYFANVFTAAANSNVAAAGFYSPTPNAGYTINVYVNPTSGPMGSASLSTVSGTIATAGYHTVDLATLVPVTAGQTFSVVVKINTPGYNYPICLEMPYSGYSSKASASPGQSYISGSGTSWMDLTSYYSGANVCLKAFTLNSGAPPPSPGVLSVSPTGAFSSSGTIGGPFSPSSTTYTLTNTGGSSINWTATPSDSWIGLSAASGSLAGGASATVTVSITADANTLATGSYSGSVAFANTTNGSGSTTRSVSLTVNPTPTPTPGALSVTPATGLTSSGPAGGPFSPSSATYTLTNTGGSSINWTAGEASAWLSLSTAGGSLAAGASTSVTVSINSNANLLQVGSYADTVSFTNTTNGSGNASRTVSLTVSSVTPPPPSGSYSVVPATYSWIDPTYHRSLYLYDDSMTSYIMPFTFTFYGKPYSTLWIGSNGLMGFAYSGMYLYANGNIPSTCLPNCAIYPYWDNLNPQLGGSVRVGISGSSPNRKIVVSWVGVPSAYNPASKFTFQALLCEGTGDIIFQYQNVVPTDYYYGSGAGATIGIENESGTQACRFSYNTRSLSNGMAIRFTTLPTLTGTRKLRHW